MHLHHHHAAEAIAAVHAPHAVAAVAVVHTAILLHPHAVFYLRRLFASAAGLFARKPKVSVITPTWQRPELLNKRCRPSVAHQTYDGPVEHIVVSDGPDSTVEICLPEHIPEVNRGVSARNYGISLAAGDVIAYLDDDNSWRPDHLERLVAALDGADFAYTRALCLREDGLRWTIGGDLPSLGTIDTSMIGHWSTALDTASWELSSEPPDWHLVRRWMEAGLRWKFDPTVTVNYYARMTPP